MFFFVFPYALERNNIIFVLQEAAIRGEKNNPFIPNIVHFWRFYNYGIDLKILHIPRRFFLNSPVFPVPLFTVPASLFFFPASLFGPRERGKKCKKCKKGKILKINLNSGLINECDR
jgi:hypothetical protein